MRDFIYTQPITALIILSVLIPYKKLLIIRLITLGFYFLVTLHNSIRLLTTYIDTRIDLNYLQIRTREPLPPPLSEEDIPRRSWADLEPTDTDSNPNIEI